MRNLTLTKEEHIKNIIDNFDFHKVNKVMTFLNWTWAGSSKSPSISQLKVKATELLNDICDDYYDNEYWEFASVGSGGFEATRYEDHIGLEFVVSGWSTEMLNSGEHYEKMKIIREKERKLKIRKKKIETIQNIEDENS